MRNEEVAGGGTQEKWAEFGVEISLKYLIKIIGRFKYISLSVFVFTASITLTLPTSYDNKLSYWIILFFFSFFYPYYTNCICITGAN